MTDPSATDPGVFGRHLREVVDRFHAQPTSEHRRACKCKKCQREGVNGFDCHPRAEEDGK